jgi:polysaccharide export outer membrane protein
LAGGCGASLNNPDVDAAFGPAGQPGAAKVGDAVDGSQQTEAAKIADKFTSVAKPGSAGYKIGPQDVLDISVFKVPDLSKSLQVADSGTINMPLVGDIRAAGLTAQEVERNLTKKLGASYLQNPQVTVFVKEFNSQRVTVEGAVKKPGVYPFRGQNSLLQMIAQAEGLNDVADSTVVVFRQMEGKRAAARFDIDAIRRGESDDPSLQPGDLIVANSSALKETFGNVIKALPVASVFALL